MVEPGKPGAEQRQFPRRPVDRDVVVELNRAKVPARLIEYSEGGASVTTDVSVRVEIGDEVRLVLDGAPDRPAASVQRVTAAGFALHFDKATVAQIIGGWLMPQIDG